MCDNCLKGVIHGFVQNLIETIKRSESQGALDSKAQTASTVQKEVAPDKMPYADYQAPSNDNSCPYCGQQIKNSKYMNIH